MPTTLESYPEPRRGEGSPRRAAALALLLSLFLALGGPIGCGDEGDGTAADSSATDSTAVAAKPKKAKKPKRASVTVAEVIRDKLVLPIHAEGTVRARRQTEIRPEIAGRIQTLAVAEGQRVKKGQLLLRLDARDYEVALAEAQSQILTALSTLALEEEDYEPGSAAGTPLDLEGSLDERVAALRSGAYRSEIAAARTGVAAAEAAERRARLNLERCAIRAPFAGVVNGLTLSEGEWLSGGQVLFTLVDDINLEAQVNVLESDLGFLAAGRPSLLTFPAIAETLQVSVDVIGATLDTDSRSCPALLRLSNVDGRVKPGMFTRAAIAGEILSERLLVPREAVLTRDGRPLVFKVQDGITQWLYVQLGRRNEQFVEIERVLQGGSLEPGDQVVVTNHLTLTHGAQVKVKKTLKPISPWRLAEGENP